MYLAISIITKLTRKWAVNTYQAKLIYSWEYLKKNTLNPLNNNMKLLYLKFADHIFLIWTRTLEELIKYKEQVNTIHPAIKFDFNFFF